MDQALQRNSSLAFEFLFGSSPRSSKNDIVLDFVYNFAYITDSGLPVAPSTSGMFRPHWTVVGGLIVMDMLTREAWRVLNEDVPAQPEESLRFSYALSESSVGGYPVLVTSPMMTGADGIALSCDCETLYFCPLTSRILYSLPTEMLRQPGLAGDLNSSVIVWGVLHPPDRRANRALRTAWPAQITRAATSS